MAERIASGDIEINVKDDKALADLHRIEAEFDKAMSDISRKKATANIDVNLKEFKKDLKEAEAELARFDKRRKDVSLSPQERQAAQRQLHDLENQVVAKRKLVSETEKAAKAQRTENDAAKARADIESLLEKRQRAREKVAAAAASRELNDSKKIIASNQRLAAAEEKRERQLSAAANRQKRDDDRKIAAYERELSTLPKLQRQYAELGQKIKSLDKARRKATDEDVELVIDLKIAEAMAEMKTLKGTLERLGGPIDVDVRIKPGRALGQSIRNAFDDGGIRSAVARAGSDSADTFVKGFQRKFNRRAIGNNIQAGFQKVGDALSGLGDARFAIGPINTSIKGMIAILGTLGPVILGVIGSLGALVAVTGSAAAGIGALSIGFLGGAIPAAIGFIGVIKPMIAQFSAAKKASDALAAATLKYGASSKQAKTAQDQLNQTLKGTDRSTVDAFKSISGLSARWKELTAPARAAGFNVIGDAIKLASDNMGMFARKTNDGFKAASSGLRSWIKGIGSTEGKNLIGNMMDNFNKSIPPIMHGLGQLGVALGRIGSAASDFLPGLFKGFDKWATSIAKGTSNAAKLHSTIGRMVDSLRNIGHLAAAAGKFLVSFFSAGVGAGNDLVKTMTAALNGWTAFNRSTKGRSELTSFFQNAVANTKAFVSALAPLIAGFVKWAAAITPAITGFLQGATYVTRFVTALTGLLKLGGGMHALAVTFGALWAVGKIRGSISAITNFTSALLGLKKAEEGVAAAQAAGGASKALSTGESALMGAATSGARKAEGQAIGAAEGAAAGAATGKLRGLRAAASGVTGVLEAMGPAGTLAAIGIAGLGAAAIIAGNKFLHADNYAKKFSDSLKDYNQQTQTSAQLTQSIGEATYSYGQTVGRVADLKAKLNAAEEKSGKNSAAYRTALGNLNDALRTRGDLESTIQSSQQKMEKSSQKSINDTAVLTQNTSKLKSAEADRAQAQKRVDVAKATGDTMAQALAMGQLRDANQRVEEATKRRDAAQVAANKSAQQQAINAVNYQRAIEGLIPASGQAAVALAKLYQANSKVSKAVSTKFADPKDAAKVATASTGLLKSGVSAKSGQTAVLNIVANSANAEQAIRRINALLKTVSAARSLVKIGVSDEASNKIASIVARVRSMPAGKARIAAEDRATSTIAHIISSIAHIPNKQAKLIAQDLVSGKAKAAAQAIDNVHGKQVKVVASVTGQGAVSAIAAQIGALHDKIVRVSIQAGGSLSAKSAANSARAAGRGPIGAETALVGEGNGPEFVANHKTGMIRKITAPTFMDLDKHDAVIPTEAAYRSRGAKYFKEFAKTMGIPGFLKGKSPKYSVPKVSRGKDPEKISSVAAYRELQQKESDLDRQKSIDESKVREPDSLTKVTGKDEFGNDVYEVDFKAVDLYRAQLQKVANDYTDLLGNGGLMDQLASTGEKAQRDLQTYIQTRYNNIQTMKAARERDHALSGSKDAATKKAAKQRYDSEGAIITSETGLITDAKSTQKDIADDLHDAGFRRQEYGVDSSDLQVTIDSLSTSKLLAQAAKDTTDAKSNDGTDGTGSGSGSDAVDNSTPDTSAAQIADLTAQLKTANIAAGVAGATLSAFGSSGDIGQSLGGLNAFGAVLNSSGSPASQAVVSALSGGTDAAALVGRTGAPATLAPSGDASGGGGTVININTLHPGDPNTLAAVGSAAAGGFSGQSYRATTRFPSV